MVDQNGTMPEILDLDLAPEGVPIRIDGHVYHTIPPKKVGMRQMARIKKTVHRVQKATQAAQDQFADEDREEIDEAVLDEYDSALHEFGEFVMPDTPKEVLEALEEWQFAAILEVFWQAKQVASQPPNSQTPENSSLDSEQPMAEATRSGKRSRSRG